MPLIPLGARLLIWAVAVIILWLVTDHPWWMISAEAGALAGTPGLDF